MIPNTRREYIEVSTIDLEELISETYGWREGWFTFNQCDDLGEDDRVFEVDPIQWSSEYISEEMDTIRHAYDHNNICPMYRTNSILLDLCSRGFIDSGMYIVEAD